MVQVANQFQSWQSVKVTDANAEAHTRAGVVKSASEYTDGKKVVVDVQLDGDSEVTVFEASQIAPV